jgi:hypothetical protein
MLPNNPINNALMALISRKKRLVQANFTKIRFAGLMYPNQLLSAVYSLEKLFITVPTLAVRSTGFRKKVQVKARGMAQTLLDRLRLG